MRHTITSILTFILISVSNSYAFQSEANASTPPPVVINTQGSGTPILYLPGFSNPGSIWKETVASLNKKHTAHLVSYAGFNGHAPIEMPWYTTIKEALITYIETEDLKNLTIIGHSMGGNLAVDLAAALPNHIQKLVIVDALACMREVMMPNVPAETLVYDSAYNQRMLSMDSAQFEGMAHMMASNMTNQKDKVAQLKQWILEADRKTYSYGYTDLLKLDLRPTLKQVKAETLILGASFPNISTAEQHFKNQYANLQNKSIKMASNSRHFIMFDQPEWLYKTLNDFLNND